MKQLLFLSLIITMLFSCTKVNVMPSHPEGNSFDSIIPIGLPKSIPDTLYPYQLGYFVAIVKDSQVLVRINFGGGNHIAGTVFFQAVDNVGNILNDSLSIPADEKHLYYIFHMENDVKVISVTNIKY